MAAFLQKNIGKRLSIDETSLSKPYTILTNKATKGKKGTIVAMAGNKAETVIAIIEKKLLKQRNLVQKITLDMAGNMGLIAKKCFSSATRVTDCFHVQKLAQKLYKKSESNTLASHRARKRGYRKSQEKIRTLSFDQWRNT